MSFSDMLALAGWIPFILSIPLPSADPTCWELMAAADVLWLAAALLEHDWPWAVLNAALLAFCLWMRNRNRRNRRRARDMYGAKSRALLAAVVRKAREAAQPRPVLVPGGAR